MPETQSNDDEFVSLMKTEGLNAMAALTNISVEKNCLRLIDKTPYELGGLDILRNNNDEQTAVKAITDLTNDRLLKTYETNARAIRQE